MLEEIGLAAWHGDGRTTTVREIEEHCRASGVGKLLDSFKEGTQAGVTRLLAAFFFRQYGQRASGDPTFVFTHKSFGEYLAARRIVRATERVIKELERRASSPDEGWDERDALRHWTQICGPSAVSPYLHVFLLNEVRLHGPDELLPWQDALAKLFSCVLAHSLPMEQLQLVRFKDMMFQSRNAEEALLAALNACARVTGQASSIRHPDAASFGAWLRRVQGQRVGPESVLALRCLSQLDLTGCVLHMADLYGADLRSTILKRAELNFAVLVEATLNDADLGHADMQECMAQGADFGGADLGGARARAAVLRGANFANARLVGASFSRDMVYVAMGLPKDLEHVHFLDDGPVRSGEAEMATKRRARP